MRKRIDAGKVIFVSFLVLLGYLYLPGMLDSLSDNLFSGDVTRGTDGIFDSEPEDYQEDVTINKKALKKPINERINDEDLNIEIFLESFTSYEDDMPVEGSMFSDPFYVVGEITNNNEAPISCYFNVTVKFEDMDKRYEGGSEVVPPLEKKGFEILIELPDGKSDIDFEYSCRRVPE